MFKEEKCVEYYFDSSKYNKEDILNAIKKEEKGFEKHKSDIDIRLNEYGIYVVKVIFMKSKLSKMKIKLKQKKEKQYDEYYENKVYGEYKQTKTYQPI